MSETKALGDEPKSFGSSTSDETRISCSNLRSHWAGVDLEAEGVEQATHENAYLELLYNEPPKKAVTMRMGGNKALPPFLSDPSAYAVDFEGPDDPLNPLNWPLKKKVFTGFCLAYATFILTWASSIYSVTIPEMKEKFGLGQAPAALGISLYVLGFAVGPILWGPASEIYGRKPPLLISTCLFLVFNFWCAGADHFYQIMLYRFALGALGSAPLVNTAASFADFLPQSIRGVGSALFGLCVMGGPSLAPAIGGFITASFLGWRWTSYITGIMSAVSVLLLILLPESYHPVILAKKAKKLRQETGNNFIYAEHENLQVDVEAIFQKVLATPIKMLFKEPCLLLMSVYHGFVYGILYMFLECVPLIFSKYGWEQRHVDLPYLAMFVGCLITCLLNIFVFDRKFRRDLGRSGKKVFPEFRLPLMIFGGITFPIGLFWMCWTGAYAPHVHWLAPLFGLGVTGMGLMAIFNPIFSYIVDTYLYRSASAIAANTFLRSSMGAAFPIFATPMFNNLGIQWAGTLLGCLAVLLAPMPILFYRYGPKLRAMSSYAPQV